jgi:hypothetical protein
MNSSRNVFRRKMVKGILADINARGQVVYLVQLMRSEAWIGFGDALGLVLRHFEDVGLTPTSTDLEIWQRCQAEQLVLITDNRNYESADSLEGAIRKFNRSDSLPVFTIGDLNKFSTTRSYAEHVVEKFYDYLLRIDTLRGTGRIYLP